MQTTVVGFSNWDNFGGGAGCCSYVDPNYSYQYVSVTAFNVYLAPLD
jgi:hypothetical protein